MLVGGGMGGTAAYPVCRPCAGIPCAPCLEDTAEGQVLVLPGDPGRDALHQMHRASRPRQENHPLCRRAAGNLQGLRPGAAEGVRPRLRLHQDTEKETGTAAQETGRAG